MQASKYPRNRYSASGSNLGLLEYVKKEFEAKGMDTFASELVRDLRDHLEEDADGKYVIDGFRAPEEVELVGREVATTRAIAVFANARVRFERNLARKSKASIDDYFRFAMKDFTEYSFGLARLIASANRMIINEESLAVFESKVLSVVRESLTIA